MRFGLFNLFNDEDSFVLWLLKWIIWKFFLIKLKYSDFG